MTVIGTLPGSASSAIGVTPGVRRGTLLVVIGVAVAASFVAGGTDAASVAIAHDGAAFTRLIRFMAAIKALIAVGAAAAVLWRLGAAITLPWFAGYALACGAMAAGPGLIWGMAHIGLGALLLHGGLLASILLLWRDPATANRLAAMVAARSG
jgi:hypothetical protein